MKTKIISFSLLLLFTQALTIAQDWEFVGLDSMLIKQLYVSGDTIWAGTDARINQNMIAGLYRSTDGGVTWKQTDSILVDGTSVCFTIDFENDLYFLVKGSGSFNIAGYLYKSLNGGKDWERIKQLENMSIDWLGISTFNNAEIYAKESFFIISGEYETVYRSLDGGINWEEITYFPASSHGRSLSFNMSLTDSSTLYASVDDRMFDTYFYKSSNKGDSWNYISEPAAIEQELITDPNSPNRIFIFPGYHFTEDDGYAWTVADSGLNDVTSYLSFYIDPLDKTTFYNLRKDGLYFSKSNPIYWELVEGSDQLPLNIGSFGFIYQDIGQLRNIFIDTVSNVIYIGTAKGIYKKDLITDVEEIENDIPFKFILHQNYPNPFNPVTTITYQVPENSFVTIKVYDVIGNLIKTLLDQEQHPGTYKKEFNAAELSSGVYFYVLTAIKENGLRIREGKKMLLIK